MMMRAFVDNADGGVCPVFSPSPSPAPLPRLADDCELLRVMLIGSASGITATIHNLHRRGFAEVGDWSPLIPWSEGEMMSVLTKRLRREG
jgi:hypothetical protein